MRHICRIAGFAVIIAFFAGCAGNDSMQAQQTSKSSLSTHGDSRFKRDNQPDPSLQEDACALLAARPYWREALIEAQRKWRVEPWVVLAFMYQESRFDPHAMSKSHAYGYAQVKQSTWQWYKQKTEHRDGKRDRFDDAADFIGFYVTQNHLRNDVDINNVKNQYLAYHEGMGGFARGTYIGKPWLLKVADKVVDRAARYQAQLLECPL